MPTTIDEQVKNYLFGRDELKLPGRANRLGLCVVCGRMEPMGGIYTCKGEDVICPACLKAHEGLAYLMCRSCGNFMGFYKPGIVKLTERVSVRIDPGDTLHFTWCPKCNPNLGRYDIEEFRDIASQELGNSERKEEANGMEGTPKVIRK